MVYTLRDWNSFKQASSSENCTHGCFQTRDFGKEQKVVVISGRFGYTAKLPSNSPELKDIMAFCKDRRFLEIAGSTEAETLLSSR
jgi:hypothetical protein